MRLAAIDLYRYTLPLTAPLILKGESLHERRGFLMRVKDDAGHTGWGDVAPLPGFSRESLEDAARQLQDVQRNWTGQQIAANPVDPDHQLAERLDQKVWVASVRFGIEVATWDLFAAETDSLMPDVLCPEASPVVSLNGLLLGNQQDIIDRATQMRAEGYRAVKLKVGRKPVADDVALVHEVRSVLGDAVALRLDANRLWTMDEAVAFAEGIAGVPIAYIEEPLRDFSLLPTLAERTKVPIALDESLMGMPVAQLQAHAYAAAVVLKPTLVGGVAHTLRMARTAQSLGMTPVLSAAFETGVGLRGLIALAACLGKTPVGLDTYHWLAEDVLEPRLVWDVPDIDVATLMEAPRHISEHHLEPLLSF
ncbi:MAG TPA: o-succinylbenzoate synthase [Rhodothermales bacterium]|nr:o-succinylbenzoate synthase [Rhodothermales bacterium]